MSTPSKYQQDIFDWFTKPTAARHLVVEAVAGSGKSWTIKRSLALLAGKKIRVVAFNKHIATAMQAQVPPGVQAVTLHSFCLNECIKRNWQHRIQIKASKVADILKWDVMSFKDASPEHRKDFYRAQSSVCQMIALLKAQSYVADEVDSEIIDSLSNKHNIEIPTLKHHEWTALLGATWRAGNSMTRVIDFDDMIYYPILHNMDVPRCDYVFVDEAQDLNPVQIDIVAQMADHVVAVGDRHQAIYGFRGADAEAIDKLIAKLESVDELPLSICYRCPVAVVEAAKAIVPHIEAAPNAEQGEVRTIKADAFITTVQEGDYVLCRTTAPLVSGCLSLVADGIRAKVLGRDIGKGLLKMIDSLHLANDDLEQFLEALSQHESAEYARLKKRERDSEIMTLQDKISAIKALVRRCSSVAGRDNVSGIKATIEEIFADDEQADTVIFSTVHKSKGLEARTIFILRPDLMPHPMAEKEWQRVQESNLKYVAITRAMQTLIWVTGTQEQE